MHPYPKVRSVIRSWVAQAVFEVSFRRFRTIDDVQMVSDGLLAHLIYGWGNAVYSVEPAYLRACLLAAAASRQPILECGSGLSTLLLGVVAARRDSTVWSLEHHAAWAERVSVHLQKRNIGTVKYCVAPLHDYGRFTWYDISSIHLPDDFGVVVCDGPPESTPGGRYGLLPVMQSHLAPGCLILMDDFKRKGEQQAAEQWQQLCSCTVEARDSERGYAAITVH